MPLYRKKPVVIEAMRVERPDQTALLQWLLEVDLTESVAYADAAYEYVIHTLEGDMRAEVGDWIIHDVQGEFYPCKPDIFEATYEPVES